MSEKENIQQPKFPDIFWLSIVAGVVIIVMNILRWSLVEMLTPFMEPLFELMVFGSFIFTLLWSLVYGLLRFKKQKLTAILPLVLDVLYIKKRIRVESSKGDVFINEGTEQFFARISLPKEAIYGRTAECCET